MLLEMILMGIVGAIGYLLEPFPTIPPMPAVISSGGDWFKSMILDVTGIVSFVLSPPLFIALVTGFLVIFNLERFWSVFRWILNKLPFNIR